MNICEIIKWSHDQNCWCVCACAVFSKFCLAISIFWLELSVNRLWQTNVSENWKYSCIIWYCIVPYINNKFLNVKYFHLLSIHSVCFCFFLQNEQVPAARVQLHTQNLDLPRRVHPVPELCEGAAAETQTKDLYRKTGEWSHGSRVGRVPAHISEQILHVGSRGWNERVIEAEDRKQESERGN